MHQKFPHLLAPLQVGGLRLKNRFYVAPTGMHALQGRETYPNDEVIAHFADKARGGAGVVCYGGITMARNRPSDGMHQEHTIECMEDKYSLRYFKKLTDVIHLYGAKASLEVSIPGTHKRYGPEGVEEYGVTAGTDGNGNPILELTPEVMAQICEDHRSVVRGAKLAGFDILLYQCGHGGALPAQFLSPHRNFRTDAYNGSLACRARFPLMLLEAMHQEARGEILIELRMSGSDGTSQLPGWKLDEAIAFAEMAQGFVDLFQVSCGDILNKSTRAVIHPSGFLPEAPNAYLAKAFKDSGRIHKPIVAIGGIFAPETAERLIAEGWADAVCSARGFIADPERVNKAASGREKEIVPCIKCFHCLDNYKKTNCLDCSVNPRVGREYVLDRYLPAAGAPKRVLIAGGGPAGMRAALELVRRGHSAILCEKEGRLGGQLQAAAEPSFKYDLKHYREYLADQVCRHPGIQVRLQTEVTPELVEQLAPDALFVAVGAEPRRLPIPGAELSHVRSALEVYDTSVPLGQQILVVGGGEVGCETALYLSKDRNRSVVLLEMGTELAPEAILTYRIPLLEQLACHVETHCGVQCVNFTPQGGWGIDGEGQKRFFAADTVVLSVGMQSRSALAQSLAKACPVSYLIGDCQKPRNVKYATKEAFDCAILL